MAYEIGFASDSSFLIRPVAQGHSPSPNKVSLEAELQREVHHAFRLLSLQCGKVRGILNFHPAYRSLIIDFDPYEIDPQQLKEQISELLTLETSDVPFSAQVREIPVHYGGDNGPDLAEVARVMGLTEDEVVRRHSAVEYEVAFLGFSPGFPYLMGLPPELNCPRRSVPRLKVPAGSVAIGGAQTGIYPEDSPGGWQVIGRTNLKLFDPNRGPPSLFAPGDRIRFIPSSNQSRGSSQGSAPRSKRGSE